MPVEVEWEPLIAAATEVRQRAHAPYSRFPVGAAVLTESGRVHTGCNVENRSFGLTLCAERVAIASAVADAAGRPRAVVVVTDTDPPAAPCGLCRETLAEFAGPELPVLLVGARGESRLRSLGDLFPDPFVFPPA